MTELRTRLPGVAITCAAEVAPLSRTWNQVAKTGQFKGHVSGEFAITQDTYNQILANFSATENRGVAVDYEHVSETLNAPNIATEGVPAQAWVVELAVRGDELWGLFEWVNPTAVQQVRSKQYRYLSPAIVFQWKDPVSGQNCGAKLTSVALTNTPFLDGMQPVTASLTTESVHIDGPVEVIKQTSEKTKMDELLAKMRKRLGLQAEASADEVYNSVDQMCSANEKHLRAQAEAVVLSRKNVPADAHAEAVTMCLKDRPLFDKLFPEVKEPEKSKAKESEKTVTVKIEDLAEPIKLSNPAKVVLSNQVVKAEDEQNAWSQEQTEEDALDAEIARLSALPENKDARYEQVLLTASKNLRLAREQKVVDAVVSLARGGR